MMVLCISPKLSWHVIDNENCYIRRMEAGMQYIGQYIKIIQLIKSDTIDRFY